MARAAEVGVEARLVKLDRLITQEELERKIRELNADESVDGIIVQVTLFNCQLLYTYLQVRFSFHSTPTIPLTAITLLI